ncbi:alanine dehydrogenase [Vagococcus xieshaowenii]|uniref:Alanine dehydrogenase n=1 Tax=Vagococcus xieshaowenii TaxID=2562451 RepID=A0AAJ5EEX4_9ENTE|nr:alanine dehydrogenase [Vagococcus xieshaowenii]QCA27857.1 alanine dehydrogenase [Vagococcus xieshaowenii]TFZ42430.1 alanine dehydrogenase [Vagococcus xieshaowenii]
MKIGVPKEIKDQEGRVAITPAGVMTFVKQGHEVIVEHNAGIQSGFTNEEYLSVGAKITENVSDVWSADMVMKVKEPLKEEYQYFRENLILFTYLHLAPVKELTDALVNAGVTAIAYETVQLDNGSLPLLTPMSEIAGRMSVQIGAQFLQKFYGGAGVLLAGVPGVERGKVTIIGGGVSGVNAAKMAIGLGAQVTILDVNPSRLAELDDLFGNSIQTLMSNPFTIEQSVLESDLVIGAVLIPGRKAPKLVDEELVKRMKPGSVIVDIAIDQGGIFETTDHVTTHENPTFIKHDVIHYSVANMPGAVPRTSTFALTNSTMPYAVEIANKGVMKALKENIALSKGVSALAFQLTDAGVAKDQERAYTPLDELI